MSPIKTNLKQISDYPIKYKVVDNIEVKHNEFYKLEIFDLDTFRIEKELFPNDNPPIKKTKPTTRKASPTRKKKTDESEQTDT